LTLAKSELRSEIIEVIDDDRDAFGADAPGRPILDPEGQRRTSVVAGVVLVAVIGYGLATSTTSLRCIHHVLRLSPVPSTRCRRPSGKE
jgi:hypothetical protein